MAWNEKLKKKIREARDQVKGRADFVRRKALDEMAAQFGLERQKGEADNALYARLERVPAFREKVDQALLERYESMPKEYRVENQTTFMDELEKL